MAASVWKWTNRIRKNSKEEKLDRIKQEEIKWFYGQENRPEE